MTSLTDLARQVFAGDLYATRLTGIAIECVEPDRVVCTLDLQAQHRNAKGAVMGGVIFTLADFAMAIVANSTLLAEADNADNVELQWFTSSSTVHFLGTAHGNRLIAEASPIRRGRQQTVVQVVVTDNQQRKVAFVTSTANSLTTNRQ
ncbi:MAG: PaaI family thioesterase [Bacteroidales bacterium]|nr:PaaI family thioesterase [Bacteroidales bacterium]